MEDHGSPVRLLVVLLFFLLWAGIILYGLARLTGSSVAAWWPLSDETLQVLERDFALYAKADRWQRWRIRRRVKTMIGQKEWVGRGIRVTTGMKAMVSACAVQLMWGWEDEEMLFFRRVLIYPDRFRTRLSEQDHVGELNPGFGVLAISWKHFTEGYHDGRDARNLGLHEMGHALWVGIRKEGRYMAPWDLQPWKEWRALAEEEAERIRHGKGRLFREYAGTDQAEFFAVAVEYFFEQPTFFRDKLPDLYACMVRMLKQDPAAASLQTGEGPPRA